MPEDSQHKRGSSEIWTSISGLTPLTEFSHHWSSLPAKQGLGGGSHLVWKGPVQNGLSFLLNGESLRP